MAFQPLADLVITGTVEFGSAPAQSGSIRFSNSSSLVARNAADNGDLPLLSFSESDEFVLGDAAIPRLTVAPPRLVFNGTSLELGASTILRWSTDLELHREGADTLAQRRGTNQQWWRLYKTFTDASNYERLSIYGGGAPPVFEIEPESAGTGSDNIELHLKALGSNSRVELHQSTNVLSFGETVLRLEPVGTTAIQGALSLEVATPVASGNARTIVSHSTQISGTLSSGSSFTFTNLIPAGRLLLGVTIRVVTGITGPTSIDIGDGVDVDKWGAGIALTGGTTTTIVDFTSTAVEVYPTAQDVVITANGGDFTAGEIRCTAHWIQLIGAIA